MPSNKRISPLERTRNSVPPRRRRRGGGHDIIDKRDAPTGVGVGGGECVFDVGLTCCRAPSLDLATILAFAGEPRGGER